MVSALKPWNSALSSFFETHSSTLAYLLITAFINLARIECYLHLTASVETLVMH